MADVFSREKRSEIMSRVKGRDNLATEMRLARILREQGISGWRRHLPLFGSPDFAFSKERLALFVDGCFWHGCPLHGSIPESNTAFWQEKLKRNRKRDHVVKQTLSARGWRVLRVWQHELREPGKLGRRISRVLELRQYGPRMNQKRVRSK